MAAITITVTSTLCLSLFLMGPLAVMTEEPVGLSTTWSPLIVSDKDAIVVESGETLNLTCRDKQRVMWATHYDSLTNVNYEETYEGGHERPYISNLVIENINYIQVGYYFCVHNTTENKAKDHWSPTDVNVSAIYIFVKDLYHLLAKEAERVIYYPVINKNFTFPCKPTFPEVKVTLEDMQGHFDSREGFTSTPDGSEDMFVCGATYEDFYDEKDFIMVYRPPMVEKLENPVVEVGRSIQMTPVKEYRYGFEYYDVEEGSDVNLTCMYDHDNALIFHPSLSWKLPTTSSNQSGRLTIHRRYTRTRATRTLLIRKANPDFDSGEYRCIVQHQWSQSGPYTIVLNVLPHPDKQEKPVMEFSNSIPRNVIKEHRDGMERYAILKGSTANITCTYNHDIEAPMFMQWTLPTTCSGQSGSHVIFRNVTSHGVTEILQISQADPDFDSGEYKCTVWIRWPQTTSNTVVLIVLPYTVKLETPVVEVSNFIQRNIVKEHQDGIEHYAIEEGSTVNITCIYDNDMDDRIFLEWTLPTASSHQRGTHTNNTFGGVVTHILEIKNIHPDSDSGEYSCTARDSNGTKSKPRTIVVNVSQPKSQESMNVTHGTQYRGAVLEMIPFQNPQMTPLENELENVRIMMEYALQAEREGADIMVFPEQALTSGVPTDRVIFQRYSLEVPDPDGDAELCHQDSRRQADDPINQMSCAANASNMYIVFNVPEKVECNIDLDMHCHDGFYLYNTNVVFNRKGAIIAKYRKQHLYAQPQFDVGNNSNYNEGIFTTDFGVTFGQHIGFDVLFSQPPSNNILGFRIQDFVMPISYIDTLPFRTVSQTLYCWSHGLGVNLLAAGIHDQGIGIGDTSIYTGASDILHPIYIYNNTLDSRVLVSDVTTNVPEGIPRHGVPNNTSPSTVQSDEEEHRSATNISDIFQSVLSFQLSAGNNMSGTYMHNASSDPIQYHIDYDLDGDGNYFAFFYSGPTGFGKCRQYNQVASLVYCPDTKTSCGKMSFEKPIKATFNHLNFTVTFETPYVSPSIIDQDFQKVGEDRWDFTKEQHGNRTQVSLVISEPIDFIYSMTLISRWYESEP